MAEDMRLRVRVSAGTAVHQALERYPEAARAQMLVALAEAALACGATGRSTDALADAVRELTAALQGAGVARQETPQAVRTPQVQALDAAWE